MNFNITTNDLKLKMESILRKKLFIINLKEKEFITDENNTFQVCITPDCIIDFNNGNLIFNNIFDFLDKLKELTKEKNINNQTKNIEKFNINKLKEIFNKIDNLFIFKGGMIPKSIKPDGTWNLKPNEDCKIYTEYIHNKKGFIDEGLVKENKNFSFRTDESNWCEFCDYNNGSCNHPDKEYENINGSPIINGENIENYYFCPFYKQSSKGYYGAEGCACNQINIGMDKFKNNFIKDGIHGDNFFIFFEAATYGNDGNHLAKYYKLEKCKSLKRLEEFDFNEFLKNLVDGRSYEQQNEDWMYEYIQRNFAMSENEIIEYFEELNKH